MNALPTVRNAAKYKNARPAIVRVNSSRFSKLFVEWRVKLFWLLDQFLRGDASSRHGSSLVIEKILFLKSEKILKSGGGRRVYIALRSTQGDNSWITVEVLQKWDGL